MIVLLGLVVSFADPAIASGEPDSVSTALLIIDIQNFYFPGGKAELVGAEEAAANAGKLLEAFRKKELPVIHVRHNFEPGGEIHDSVKPAEGEIVISKDHANCFVETDLLDSLMENKIKKLVICGMMTHMCVEAATRAAHDLGFECTIVHDACATRALVFEGAKVSAEDVHNSTLSALSGTYAKVLDAETFVSGF
jgi:nicotinamidase-related amidase